MGYFGSLTKIELRNILHQKKDNQLIKPSKTLLMGNNTIPIEYPCQLNIYVINVRAVGDIRDLNYVTIF